VMTIDIETICRNLQLHESDPPLTIHSEDLPNV
jgi:hypothetical protein